MRRRACGIGVLAMALCMPVALADDNGTPEEEETIENAVAVAAKTRVTTTYYDSPANKLVKEIRPEAWDPETEDWVEHGRKKKYGKDGLLDDEIDFKMGLKDGHWLHYTVEGNLFSDTPYRNDKQHGLRLKYFAAEPGLVVARTPYVDGKKHGLQTKYGTRRLESGKYTAHKILEANWTDDQKDGVWIFYKRDGSSRKEVWKMGKEVK